MSPSTPIHCQSATFSLRAASMQVHLLHGLPLRSTQHLAASTTLIPCSPAKGIILCSFTDDWAGNGRWSGAVEERVRLAHPRREMSQWVTTLALGRGYEAGVASGSGVSVGSGVGVGRPTFAPPRAANCAA